MQCSYMVEETPEVDSAVARSNSTDLRRGSIKGISLFGDKTNKTDGADEQSKTTFFRPPKTIQTPPKRVDVDDADAPLPESRSPIDGRRRQSEAVSSGDALLSELRQSVSPILLRRSSSHDLRTEKAHGTAAVSPPTRDREQAESPPRSAPAHGNRGLDDFHDAGGRGEGELKVGDRVVHLSHGEGTVVANSPEIHVRYDSGEVHHYSLRAAARKLKLIQINVEGSGNDGFLNSGASGKSGLSTGLAILFARCCDVSDISG